MNLKYTATTLALACTFPLTAGAAPAVPAPGESLPPAPQKETNLTDNLPTANEAGAAHFTLTRITVEHEGLVLNEERLQELTAPITGREISQTELNEVLDKITAYARQKGYPAATAYIPAQTAEWGRLRAVIAPGRFGKITIDNDSRLKSSIAEGYFAGMKSGDIIKTRKVEAAMRKLQDIAGVEVGGVLFPGSEPGESDFHIKVMDGKANSFIVYAENYGSKSAGRYRYGLQGELGNLGGTGAKVDFGVLISNKHQHGYNLSAEMPVGHSGTRIGLGYSRSDYELGALAQALGAEGTADTYSIYGRTPLFDTGRGSMEVKYGYDYRNITDGLTAFNVSWKKHSHVFHLGVDGTCRLPATWLRYDLTLHSGTLVPDSQEARELASLGSTEGQFTKGTFDLTAVQSLGHATDLLCKFSAQKASGNLDSSEHIYLGGAHGVRAYPQGEGSGDEGLLGTVELRYHTPAKGLTLSTYLDAGHVEIARSGDEGNMTLKGWGVGLSYTRPGNWFARLDYARRIGSDEFMSREAESRGRLWFMAGKTF
ncbi:MAG: ShlB/FhaC/HecB family hemolysin secretion/activation protein [Selenomonas ruminantium]|nr:ShlB/FhaC/HecB family hemolysin secretion/activation protein [Selenomonas ruminantium]